MDDRQIQIVMDTFWPLLKAGVLYTIPLTLITFALGLIIAVITALIRLSSWRIPKLIAGFYVWIIRGTPLLVQLFIIFYGLPSAGIILSPYISAIIGLSLSVGAYGSEIVRAAILSIQKGQWEASYSLGMTRLQALRRIILPQAARVSIPPLGNSFISLVKDTSLVSVITFVEMFKKSTQYVAYYYEPLLIYCEVGVIYLLFCSVLSVLQNKVEKRLERFSAS
ncbi:amino acid ABC transporter permease [Cohnella lupini]|uniref:Cystine transport system permease protein n=1 Tax=Cohnella lupini TaxID=1294267 RepID=A0A3D9I1M8_9BACL|nr:amino acid ABC transporter permease [Cohnella lupini]RED55678.1 cystine transport system permease protein [Cohnella lupini]